MWTIGEVKAKGKAAFRGNYWGSVVAAILLYLLIGGSTAANSSANRNAVGDAADSGDINSVLNTLSSDQIAVLAGVLIATSATIWLISLLLKIFVFNPLQVGCYRFFKNNVSDGNAKLGEIKEGFGGYGRTFVTLFLRDLFEFLWSLLFLVPGIIKRYAYLMVPYILKDEPALSATEAITRSRKMMDGHKWQTFLMDLSFIGWFLLGGLTFGIVSVFWTNPYYENAKAALYLELKDKA